VSRGGLRHGRAGNEQTGTGSRASLTGEKPKRGGSFRRAAITVALLALLAAEGVYLAKGGSLVEDLTAFSEAMTEWAISLDRNTKAKSASCTAADFSIEGFSSRVTDDCRASSCPRLQLVGRLKNNCALAAGASVEITATDIKGNVVDVLSGSWPASTRNIASGDSQPFNFGPAMTYRPEMKKFDIRVIEARTWK
jgi:hypothetical protein